MASGINDSTALLSKYYNTQNAVMKNTGYSDSVQNQKTKQTQDVNGIFELPLTPQPTQFNPSDFEDTFEKSPDLARIENFGKSFASFVGNENLAALGSAMKEAGILDSREKMAFDVLYKFNPSLESSGNAALAKSPNLNPQISDLLASVGNKIDAVRYFGNF